MGGSVMASIINATTTGITVTGDNSGQLTLSANGVTALTANTTGYLNFAKQPTIGGVQWPAFSAYPANSTNITSSTWTKMIIDTELFDTNNNFDSTTNYRFTPTIAGYYQINLSSNSYASNNNAYWNQIAIYKNGTAYIYATPVFPAGNIQAYALQLSQLISMNGSSDYLEFYVNIYVASGTPTYSGGSSGTLASGYLARAA